MIQLAKDDLKSRSLAEPSDDELTLRLSPREWCVTIVVVLVLACSVSSFWKRVEPLNTTEDFRVPFTWSDDYWTYQRHVDQNADPNRILVLGDSVVWGEYVTPDESLHAALNRAMNGAMSRATKNTGEQTEVVFANGGVNGLHPLAMQGLLRHYTSSISRQRVILHCNLLWTSSVERDLQVDEEVSFNHPDLLPQFSPSILSYRASAEHRLSISIQNRLPYRVLSRHFRVTNFEFQDVPSWSIEHPYESPWAQLRFESTAPRDEPHSPPIVWSEKIRRQLNMPWVDLKTSNQWAAFQDCVKLLQSRNNKVFVVVGPLNEHCLTPESGSRYRQNVDIVSDWLRDRKVSHFVPKTLSAEQYGDASHPLASGYQSLADEIATSDSFVEWMGRQSR
jgi:hypothetical protein